MITACSRFPRNVIPDKRKDQLTELDRDERRGEKRSDEREKEERRGIETLLIDEEEDSHEKSVHRRP